MKTVQDIEIKEVREITNAAKSKLVEAFAEFNENMRILIDSAEGDMASETLTEIFAAVQDLQTYSITKSKSAAESVKSHGVRKWPETGVHLDLITTGDASVILSARMAKAGAIAEREKSTVQ